MKILFGIFFYSKKRVNKLGGSTGKEAKSFKGINSAASISSIKVNNIPESIIKDSIDDVHRMNISEIKRELAGLKIFNKFPLKNFDIKKKEEAKETVILLIDKNNWFDAEGNLIFLRKDEEK